MPQNLESDFQKAVIKLRQSKRKVFWQKVGVGSVLVGIVTGFAWFGLKNNSTPSSTTIILGIAILVSTLCLTLYLSKSKLLTWRWNPLQIRRLKFDRIKPFPSFVIIITIVSCLKFTHFLLLDPFSNLVVSWRYAPTPPLAAPPWLGKQHQTIHHIIKQLTPEIEQSIESVAKYIDRHEPDPYLKIKALHDYVISRVIYDLDVLKTGVRPEQDATTVFRSHKAVCEGYSRLFTALGQAIGIDIVYVEGKIRKDLVPLDLIPKSLRVMNFGYDYTLHAWNTVKIAGNWQLVDTTWDGVSPNQPPIYKADYLMPTPEAMISSHLPDRSAWQLLSQPIERDSFEDLPLLELEFFTDKLQIVSPVKYQTKVRGSASIEIKSPQDYQDKIAAIFSKETESQDITKCQSQTRIAGRTQITCDFPGKGDYVIRLYKISKSEPVDLGQLKFTSL